jgi:hypothetical protein
VSGRLVPGGTFAVPAPLTPEADTTIRVSGTLVAQVPMADPDKGDALTCFDEY